MEDVLAVCRLLVAVPLAVGGFARITGSPRGRRAASTAAIIVAFGLTQQATAWWSAVLALGCLVAEAILAEGALPLVIRGFTLAIPASVVLWVGWAGSGPDIVSWLSGLGAGQLAVVVAALAALGFASARPDSTAPTPVSKPLTALIHTNPAARPSGAEAAHSEAAADGPSPATQLQTEAAAGGPNPATQLHAEAAAGRPAAAALIRGEPELTIGMATYDDFDGVYFTLQALRLYHDLESTELLVVDNYGCNYTRDLVRDWAQGTYVLANETVGTAAAKDLVFRNASGAAVLCCDSHVLFVPGAIARLKRFYRDNPGCGDLLQGPLVYDDGKLISTHFDPVWRDQMWGVWATDPRGLDGEAEPFEIQMQGLGAFSCRRDAWPGFHPGFRGFGGEEGYLHTKFRLAGRRCLCLPWLRWMHRFGRPHGIPYPLTVEDKLRNYVLGHVELGLDLEPVLSHFAQYLPADRLDDLVRQSRAQS